MDLNFKKVENVILLYPLGRFDVNFSADFEKEINKLIKNESTNHFIFNLKDVEYISSSGLGVFMSIKRILKAEERKLVLCNMNSAVRTIFNIVKLNDMFDIFNSENEAIEFLKEI